MSREAKRHLWWLIFATAIAIPNCVGPRRSTEVPPAVPLNAAGNVPQVRASTPPAFAGNDGLNPTDDVVAESSLESVAATEVEQSLAATVLLGDDTLTVDTLNPEALTAPAELAPDLGDPGIIFESFAQGDLQQPIIVLRIEQLPAVTISALTRDTTLLVPFGLLTDIAAILVGDVEPGVSFAGQTGRGRVTPFVINTDSASIRHRNRVIPVDTMSAVWFNDDLYLSLDVLTDLLQVQAQMDWSDLALRIYDASHLPAVERYDRALRRRLYEEVGDLDGAVKLRTPFAPIDGAVFDWSVTSFTSDPVQSSIVQLGGGAQVAGGSMDVRYSRANGSGTNAFDWSWIRAWSDNPYVRQLRFGEIATTGNARTPILGGSITNAPFVRPVAFASEILAGEFPEGWEVEVYRGQQLIAFAVVDSTGQFSINLPVRYGQNPVTLVGYGPRGEVVVRERTFEIPFQRLPSGQFEYGVSAGQCQITHCEFGQNVDLRYGVTDRLTLQAGSQLFTRQGQNTVFAPYALGSFALTRSFSVTGEAVLDGLVRARADFAPTPDLRMSLTQTWFDQSDPTPLTGSVFETQRTQFFGFFRPPLMNERIYFEARGLRSQGPLRNQDIANVSSTIRLAGARLTGGLFLDRIEDALFVSERSGVETGVNTILQGPTPILRTLFVRADARYDFDEGLNRATIAAGRQILRPLRVDVRLEWDELMGSSVNVELTSIFRQMRAQSRNQYTGTSLIGSQQVEGSVMWNRPGGRAEFTSGHAMGRAGVSGVVFLDENLNGIRDLNEEPIPGATVRVASQFVTSDSLGYFATWNLVPFEPALVEVDRMSIDNPLWVPAVERGYFTPTPNSYQQIDIPILQGGEVNGTVAFEDGRPVMGATVLLIHQQTGDTTQTMTFSDGTFYAFGLRPGDYVADLAASVQNRLGGVVASMAFAIKPEQGILFADDVLLVFVRDDK